MDFVTPLYRTLQAQATLDNTQAQTLGTQVLAQERLGKLAQNNAMRQIMQQLSGQMGGTQPFGAGQPPQPLQQALSGAQQEPDPLEQIQGHIGALENKGRELNFIGRALVGVDPDAARDFLKASADVSKSVAANSIDALKLKANVLESVGGIASAVNPNDPATFQVALNQIPRFDRRALNAIPFDRMPNGTILPTPRNMDLMRNFGEQTMTAAQQANVQHQIMLEAQSKRSFDQRQLEHQETLEQRKEEARDRNQRAAVAQAGITQRAEEMKQERERSRFLRSAEIGNQMGSQYRQESGDFMEKKPYFVSSYRYLFNDKGEQRSTAEMDSSSDMALRDAYLKTVHPNYKGSVFEKKELEKLANLPTRFVNSFVRLAEGSVLPNDIRYEMFNAMKRQFNVENEEQIKRENAYMDRARRANIEPQDIEAFVPRHSIQPAQKAAAPAPTQAAPVVTGGIARITNDAEFNALPSGARFIGPDGKERRKP